MPSDWPDPVLVQWRAPPLHTCAAAPSYSAGVEVSPGVFKDVPGEVQRHEPFVYAHSPTGAPGEGVVWAQWCQVAVAQVLLAPKFPWVVGGCG